MCSCSGPGGTSRERDLDLHQMVLALGERQTIRDGRLRRRRGHGDTNETQTRTQKHARC